MVKNRLERRFSEYLKKRSVWYMKLQVSTFAHKTTPADFLISNGKHISLVECKGVTCKEGKGRFDFKRLTQIEDLCSFATWEKNHKSFVLLAYFDKRWKDSETYMIPALEMQAFIGLHNKKSLSREDANTFMKAYMTDDNFRMRSYDE